MVHVSYKFDLCRGDKYNMNSGTKRTNAGHIIRQSHFPPDRSGRFVLYALKA